MSTPEPEQSAPKKGPVVGFTILVVVALTAVLFAWFHTPVALRASPGAGDGEYVKVRCAGSGPSRWAPPRVSEGQDISSDERMIPFSLQVLKNDIEALHVSFACEEARDAHTNTLIVTTFAAGTAIVLGYIGLTRRRQ